MSEKKSSWFFKFIFLICLVVVFLISSAIYKEISKKKEIQNEIAQLQDQARQIQKENQTFQDKLSYFESNDFQEKEAKDKLSLKNPNENMVVIKPGLAKVAGASTPEESEKPEIIYASSNVRKWWDYFFKY